MPLILVLTAAAALGLVIAGALKSGSALERCSAGGLAGLCTCGVVVLAVGSWSLRAAVYCVAGLAVAGVVAAVARRGRRCTARPHAPEPGVTKGDLALLAVVAAAFACVLISVLAPVTSWDACTAHLSLPKDYVREGHFFVTEGLPYSAYPHLMHGLFTFAYLRGSETAAGLVTVTFAAAACALAYALAKRIQDRRAGFVAAAILATAPVFLDLAGGPTLDLAFSAVVLAALMGLVIWREEDDPAWLLVMAFLAGSSCGIRHTGYVVCVLLTAAVLLSKSRSRVRATAMAVAMMAVGATPWLLRSWLTAGNPVYPFFPSLFAPDAMPEQKITAVMAHESVRGTGIKEFLLFPWNVVMYPERFDGWTKSPGPLVLLLGVPGIFVGGKRCRSLAAFSCVGAAALFFFRQYTRYYLPFFLPMMVVAAVASRRLPRIDKPLTALLAVTFLYGLALDAAAVHFKVPVALGVESREDYLTRRIERYPAFQWANENISKDEGIVLLLDPRGYFMDPPTYQNLEALRRLVGKPLDEQVDWLHSRGVHYVFYPETYVTESRGFHGAQMDAMFEAWWQDPRFRLLKPFDLPRPRAGGTERVEVYELK